jgi:hypothetical protein
VVYPSGVEHFTCFEHPAVGPFANGLCDIRPALVRHDHVRNQETELAAMGRSKCARLGAVPSHELAEALGYQELDA